MIIVPITDSTMSIRHVHIAAKAAGVALSLRISVSKLVDSYMFEAFYFCDTYDFPPLDSLLVAMHAITNAAMTKICG